MEQLTYLCSYETLKFDTISGDLEKGQYAENGKYHYFNPEDLDKEEYRNIIGVEKDSESLVGFEKKNILNEKAYYQKFQDQYGAIKRYSMTEEEYITLSIKGSLVPTKIIE